MANNAQEVKVFLHGIGERVVEAAQTSVKHYGNWMLNEFRKQSPKRSGYFAQNWQMEEMPVTKKRIAGVIVFNPTEYGIAIETGSAIGKWPWPVAKKPRTVEMDGRIWSSKAPGGIIRMFMMGPQSKAMATLITQDILKVVY